MANSLKITDLDFDLIKQNLKDYLKGQTEFTDYDFEGSGLAVLLDILAYNTHYNAFYANMAINELFIDSAVKRESVVSLSKMLNYIPRSVRSSTAIIDLTVNGVTPGTLSMALPRYTAFTTSIDDETFTFYNIEPYTITPTAGVYSYSGINLYEGTYISNKFSVVAPGPSEKYIIPNKNVDITTLRVTVQDTASSTASTPYSQFAGDITQVDDTSTIYYIEQNPQGYYEIYFGDGVLGYKLSAGNQVTVEYLVANGTAANISDKVTQTFTISGSLTGATYTSVSISVTTKSTNGQDAETIDEIRFNAPKSATSQNRLITTYDYQAFLKRNYSYIDAVTVWGGEDNDPPQYGKVFISVVPKANQYLTTTRRNTITTDIKKQRAMAITPTFVDPDVYYINITSIIKYNPNLTNEAATDIETAAVNSINTYFTQNLGSFAQDFSASKIVTAINDSNQSIISNITNFKVQKRITPSLGIGISKRIKLNNVIEQHTVSSTKFYYQLNGLAYPARIKDIPDTATVDISGTYRRSGSIVTCTFASAHNLTAGESVTLEFSGSTLSGIYTINTVTSDYTFTVVSVETGNDSGTVSVQSEARGSLQIYDPTTSGILNNSIGFVSYDSGLIQINDLNVYGFVESQTDVRLYFELTKESQDISVARNQIVVLDTDTTNDETNQLAGISVSTVAVPK